MNLSTDRIFVKEKKASSNYLQRKRKERKGIDLHVKVLRIVYIH